jgi:AhpC/TSA family
MLLVPRRGLIALLAGTGLFGLVVPAAVAADSSAQARLGAPAPNFTLTDSNGRSLSLSDFKGKTIVLEWTNHECPYVRKHYAGQNMQALQKKWTAQGVIWLTVISSHPGAQGFVHGLEANKLTDDRGAAPTAVLLDSRGGVGRSYGALVTPHMYVITGDGALVYMGGIDDKPTTRLEDLKTARNFVDAALSEVVAGKPVSVRTSRPYGCTIKYAS